MSWFKACSFQGKHHCWEPVWLLGCHKRAQGNQKVWKQRQHGDVITALLLEVGTGERAQSGVLGVWGFCCGPQHQKLWGALLGPSSERWVPGEVLREPPDILAVQPESRTSRRRKSCLKSLHLYRPSMGTVTSHLFAFALSLHKSHEFSLLFHSVFCTLHTSPLMLTAAAPCPYQPLHDQLSCSFLSKCLLM